ncbi:hypothetical protein YB2330_003442 [Saitoella coloradoensis]
MPDPSPVYFWKPEHPVWGLLSNWSPTSFTDPTTNITYQTLEHWMMYQKCLLFGDEETAKEILEVPGTEPGRVQALGKKARGFDSGKWNSSKYDLVLRGCRIKFGILPKCRDMLLSTGDRELIEASPEDRVWGVGFDEETLSTKDIESEEWGENLMGRILTEVREELKGEMMT